MPGISSQDKDDAERRITELKTKVGTLDIKGAPEGAKIVVDDEWTGNAGIIGPPPHVRSLGQQLFIVVTSQPGG